MPFSFAAYSILFLLMRICNIAVAMNKTRVRTVTVAAVGNSSGAYTKTCPAYTTESRPVKPMENT